MIQIYFSLVSLQLVAAGLAITFLAGVAGFVPVVTFGEFSLAFSLVQVVAGVAPARPHKPLTPNFGRYANLP